MHAIKKVYMLAVARFNISISYEFGFVCVSAMALVPQPKLCGRKVFCSRAQCGQADEQPNKSNRRTEILCLVN